jgi:choline dehydrogenase-like flavoprotein
VARVPVPGVEDAFEVRPPPPGPPASHTGGPPRHARLIETEGTTAPVFDQCDVLIVGSGPGGAALAWSLIDSGLKVIVLEAGRPVREFFPEFSQTLVQRMWDGGMRATRGNVMFPTLQVKAYGGGSVFNSAICMRPNPSHLAKWRDDHGLTGFTEAQLAPHFDAVERHWGVKPVDDAVQGQRNTLFREACETLGWKVEAIRRNEDGCVGSAECVYGCRNGKKLSMDRRGFTEFLEAGGKVYTSVQVDEITFDRGRATGATGHVVDARGVRQTHVRIAASVVVSAAGAINGPALLRRSGLRSEPIGANLRFHPSGYLIGLFDQSIFPWTGATQGYHCTEFLDHGIKLESLWAGASIFAQRLPLGPRQFKRTLKKMERSAVWDCWISGDDSTGTVRNVTGTGRLDIQYDIGAGDLRRLQEANALLAEMFAAAGANEVLCGIRGLPELLDASTAARQIREARLDPTDFPTSSNHVMGGLCMGTDPKRSATDAWGKVWGVDNLYVADTSLYPMSPGVNPMLTAMALGHRLGQELPNRIERRAPVLVAT